MNGPILAEQRSWMTWTGRVLTGLIVAFLAFDTGITSNSTTAFSRGNDRTS